MDTDFSVSDRRRIGTDGAVLFAEGDGHSLIELERALDTRPAEIRALESMIREKIRTAETSEIFARYQFARQNGITFGGARDEYEILGYDRTITTRQYREAYLREGIAARIVDAMPNATWRGAFELIEDEDPEVITPFEQAFIDLDRRLQIQAKLLRVDKLAGLSTYAVLLIGAPGDMSTELPKAKSPDDLLYLTPFSGGGGPTTTQMFANRSVSDWSDATIQDLDTDPESERFGLPLYYRLKRTDLSMQFTRPVHWTRILHVAENLLDDEVYGLPTLERVWNLLADLRKVTGGGAEAFWLRANQGLHLDIDKDMTLPAVKDTIEALKEQSEAYKHQLTRWIRTKGVTANVLGSDVANFEAPADAILTQIAGAKAIPKRILMGSEMGELASSQDRDNWRDQINGRQQGYAGPYIVRPLIDRLIEYGYLPSPKDKETSYEIRWPKIETLTEQEKVQGAQGWAQVNQTQGDPVFTTEEIRDKWAGLAPLTEEQLQTISDRNAEKVKQAQEMMMATQPPQPDAPPAKKDAPTDKKKPNPFIKAAAAHDDEDDELVSILIAAMQNGAHEVVHQIIGLAQPKPDLRHMGSASSGNFGHAGRPGEVGGSTGFDFPAQHQHAHFGGPAPSASPTSEKGANGAVRHDRLEVAANKLNHLAQGRAVVPVSEFGVNFESSPVNVDRVHAFIELWPSWKRSTGLGYRDGNTLHVTDGAHRAVAAKLLGVKPPQIIEESYQLLGGAGSGNFGHAGRPGEVGGSSASATGAIPKSDLQHRDQPIPLYHSGSKLGAPKYDAFYGNEEFNQAFPHEFGPQTHQVMLPPDARILDLNKSTATSREFIAEMAERAWKDDRGFAKQIRNNEVDWNSMGDGRESVYEAWTDKRITLDVLNEWKADVDGVVFEGEYLLKKELIAKLPGKNLRAAGGEGSGNFGHSGRPGEVGGSAPESGGTTSTSGMPAIKDIPDSFHRLTEKYGINIASWKELPQEVGDGSTATESGVIRFTPPKKDPPPAVMEGIEKGLDTLKQRDPQLFDDVTRDLTMVWADENQEGIMASTSGDGTNMVINSGADPKFDQSKNVAVTAAYARGLTGEERTRAIYQSTIIHEMGHVIDSVKGGNRRSTMAALHTLLEYQDDDPKFRRDFEAFSSYATASPNELFAEAFTAKVLGLNYPKYLDKVLEGL